MDISAMFFDVDGRLLSGWRFVVFCASFVFIASVLEVVVFLAFGVTPTSKPEYPTLFLIFQALGFLIPALVLGWLCNRHFEKLPFAALGASFSNGWLRNFIFGLIIGSATLGLAVAIAVLFGGLSFSLDTADSSSIVRTLGLSFLIFLFFAAWEEGLFRGYPLQTLLRSGRTIFAVVFMAVLFATLHVGNPSADSLSWINTFIAGIWFAVGYLKTRDLWLPFGMHLMWNWMQGAFFGIEVSGLTDITSAPLLKEIDRGPAWLTGEAYGIEAGVAATVALIASTVLLYFIPIKRTDASEK